jgi:hypothetical protein
MRIHVFIHDNHSIKNIIRSGTVLERSIRNANWWHDMNYVKRLLPALSPAQNANNAGRLQPIETHAINQLPNLLRAAQPRSARQKVGEEELFAGLVQSQLLLEKGTAVAREFAAELQSATERRQLLRHDSAVERATNDAVRSLRRSGRITVEEAANIKDLAFALSQFDDDPFKLYGTTGVRTATLRYRRAMEQVERNIEQLQQGNLEVLSRQERREGANERRRANREREQSDGIAQPIRPRIKRF